jgi:hypothetical protein
MEKWWLLLLFLIRRAGKNFPITFVSRKSPCACCVLWKIRKKERSFHEVLDSQSLGILKSTTEHINIYIYIERQPIAGM